MDRLLLAGDVGGTKAALALVAVGPGDPQVVAEATFESRRYRGLEEVLEEFLAQSPARASVASLSVAGPVIGNSAFLGNLGWQVDAKHLSSSFEFRSVQLMNDLQATAFALPELAPEQILTLQPGREDIGGPRAVIAPGTGLGEAFLLPNGTGYQPFPSEGGNADFAPTDALQTELLSFLQARDGHVSYEHVCSGRGIPNVYAFLRETGRAAEPEWLARALAQAPDATPVIVDAALDPGRPCEIAEVTLRLFAAILAAEAGNLALRVLATGGVYIGGGIPPRVLPALTGEAFVREFRRKGKFEDLLSQVPLHVVLEPRTALWGAIHYGRRLAPSPASSVALM